MLQSRVENDLDLDGRFSGPRFSWLIRVPYRTAAPRLRPLQTAVAMTSLPPFTVPLTPRICAPTDSESSGWTRAWGAEVRTWNAFAKGERLLLYGEVAHRECGGDRMQVFFAFSMAKRDQPIWDQLRRIRQATECDKPVS